MRIFSFYLIFIFFLSPAFAAQHVWKKIGPPGGYVSEIIPDRTTPNIWYSLVNETLYRSSDNARTWKKISAFVHSIAFQSKDQSLYAIAGSSDSTLFKSGDRGATFTVLGKAPPTSTGLKLDNNVSGLLYSMDNRSVFRSSDDGRTWEELPINFTANSDFFGCNASKFYLVDIMPSPIHSERLYASLEFSQCPIVNHKRVRASILLESLNRGTNWQVAFARKTEAYSFAFDPAYPDRAFAFNGRQIEILTSSGWSLLSKVPCPSTNCSANQLVETIGKPDGFLLQQIFSSYGSYSKRLLLSENGGKTWKEESTPFSGYLRKLGSMNIPPHGLVAGTAYGGLYRKTKNQRWESANIGIESRIVFNKVLASGNKVYAYQEDYNGILFFRSDDSGEHWKDLLGSLPPGRILFASVSPHDGNHLILGTVPNLSRRTTDFYVSKDGGRHWKLSFTHVGSGSSYSHGRILFDPVQPNVVFIHAGSSIYKSVEFGFKPSLLNLKNIFAIWDLAADVNNSKIIYLTDGRKVFRSNDGGLNFQNTGSIPIEDDGDGAVYLCQAGIKNGTFLVDNDNMAVLITTNGGERWRYLSKVPAGYGGGFDPPGAGKILSVDFKGKYLYTYSHGGLFESTNGGLSWRRLNHEWPVEKRLKGSIYASDFVHPKNGPFIVATNWGLFKANTTK